MIFSSILCKACPCFVKLHLSLSCGPRALAADTVRQGGGKSSDIIQPLDTLPEALEEAKILPLGSGDLHQHFCQHFQVFVQGNVITAIVGELHVPTEEAPVRPQVTAIQLLECVRACRTLWLAPPTRPGPAHMRGPAHTCRLIHVKGKPVTGRFCS